MTINGTLPLQIINFFIAYLLIDRLFLRKAVSVIQQERNEHIQLMKVIQEERDRVIEKEQKKSEEWRVYTKMFLQKIPPLPQRPELHILEPQFSFQFTKDEEKKVTDQLYHAIARQVLNE